MIQVSNQFFMSIIFSYITINTSENLITVWKRCILMNSIHFLSFKSIQDSGFFKTVFESIQIQIQGVLNCETMLLHNLLSTNLRKHNQSTIYNFL